MADPVVLIGFGDEEFALAHVTVQEMAKVKSWTAFRNRNVWFDAIRDEDPDALIAAYVLVKQRKGESVRFSEVDFDLDSLTAKLVDETGSEIEPVLERNADGSIKTDAKGQPVPALDAQGRVQWVYTSNGAPVPPTGTAWEPITDSQETPGSSSEFVSGIPTT